MSAADVVRPPRPSDASAVVMAVIHGATYGGPCNEVDVLADAMPETRFVVVLPDEPGSAADRLRRGGITVIQQPMVRFRRVRSPLFWLLFPVRFLRDVLALRRVMRREQIDVVHGYGINLQAAMAARVSGVPLVWSLIDSGAPPIVRAAVAGVVRRWATFVLVNGHATLSRYRSVRRGPAGFEVYYPPVNTARFAPTATAEGSPVAVGTVANLNPDKGLDVLLDAAALLRGHDVRFRVTGATHATHRALADRLKTRAKALPSGFFEFLGEADDVPARLAELDVFVVSSRSEGTTTTAIEAMAFGLPVIATRVGGVPEVVDDGNTGILVPPDDAPALAAAIRRLLDDPALRLEMGRRGRERAVREFGADRFVGQVGGAYAVARVKV